MAIEALVFDFDGLIVDTEGPDRQAWREVYAQYGVSMDEAEWAASVGTPSCAYDPCDYLEAAMGAPLPREQIRREAQNRFHALAIEQPIMPGVREYLQGAREMGLSVGLASSATRDWVDMHLSRRGLTPFFDCVRCFGDVLAGKPNPGLYLSVLDHLGVAPKAAVALEDSPIGARAAKSAGMYCVAVPNPVTAFLDFGPVDLRLPSLESMPLPELLEKLVQAEPVEGDC